MYAIISTGGKQYTVKPGDVLQVEKLEQDLGAKFDISEVLLVGGESTYVGQPLVKNALVTVVVTKQAKTRKVVVFKKKRRQSYRNYNTHRQDFTELFVVSIKGPDGQVVETDQKPVVRDMAQERTARIEDKVKAAKERRMVKKEQNSDVEASEAQSKLKKKAKTQKKETAGKKPAKKKASAKKKVTKKVTKKTK